MKFSASLALIVIVGLVASSNGLPAKKRLVYYQQPARYSAGPQRMMYVQYVQPSRQFARSTQAAEVLVAGDTVATGTYLRDCDHTEADISTAGPAVDVSTYDHGEDILSEAFAPYPATGLEVPFYSGAPTEVDIVAEDNEVAADAGKTSSEHDFEAAADASKTGREYDFEAAAAAAAAEEAAAAAEAEAAQAEADLPAPAPIAPVAKPSRRYVPSKKKVYVELDQSVETAEDTSAAVADEEEEELEYAPVPARRPVAKKPSRASAASASKAQKPLPTGTFFPIDFGGTAGGAIAIANSFSTGEGGSATSHAIAYGSPEAVRARTRPSKKH